MSISVLKLPPQAGCWDEVEERSNGNFTFASFGTPLSLPQCYILYPAIKFLPNYWTRPTIKVQACHSIELHTQDWGQPGFHLKTQMHSLFKKLRCISDTQHRKYESQLIEVQFVINVYIRFRKLLLNETLNTFRGQHWYQVQSDRNKSVHARRQDFMITMLR